jgi:hypothetical protein
LRILDLTSPPSKPSLDAMELDDEDEREVSTEGLPGDFRTAELEWRPMGKRRVTGLHFSDFNQGEDDFRSPFWTGPFRISTLSRTAPLSGQHLIQ